MFSPVLLTDGHWEKCMKDLFALKGVFLFILKVSHTQSEMNKTHIS